MMVGYTSKKKKFAWIKDPCGIGTFESAIIIGAIIAFSLLVAMGD